MGNANAFPARNLCHAVLVPLAAELGFSIVITGREPLNNQPYFRMTRLGDDTPVHEGGRAAFAFTEELVAELSRLKAEADAREALRAFIAVRRAYVPKHAAKEGETPFTPEQLTATIKALIRDKSEGGKRAQAVVAGLMDVFAGVDRVESGRINDPSCNIPGTCAFARPMTRNGRSPLRYGTSRWRPPMCKSSRTNASAWACARRPW